MGDHDAGELELFLQLLDEIAQQVRHQRVNHRSGLVVENGIGLGGQGARNGNGPLHPGGEVRGQQIAKFAHPHHVQQAVDDLVNLFLFQPAALAQGKRHVLADRQRIEERPVLKDHGDLLADALQLLLGIVSDVFVGHPDASAVRLEKAHDVMERNRFSHAASPQDADRLAGHHVEAHVIQHHLAAKGLRDALELDVWPVFVHAVRFLVTRDGRLDCCMAALNSSGVLRFRNSSGEKPAFTNLLFRDVAGWNQCEEVPELVVA